MTPNEDAEEEQQQLLAQQIQKIMQRQWKQVCALLFLVIRWSNNKICELI